MFYTFDNVDKKSAQQVGGKGFHLSQLKKAGFTVPDGGILSTDAFEACIAREPKLKQKVAQLRLTTNKNSALPNTELLALAADIKAAVERLQLAPTLVEPLEIWMQNLLRKGYPSVAVRSSSLLEDLVDNSFAGQYESVLGVRDRAGLIAAILTCWASAFDSKVIQYSLSRCLSLKKLMPAVVIQGLIDAEVSGVVFTVDPLSGDDCTMVIDATEGLGQALVQGAITPQHYRYHWYQDDVNYQDSISAGDNTVSNQYVKAWLNQHAIKSLCDVALDIQTFYGLPQDIEWAYWRGQFYILQARPIAAIHFTSDSQWSNADLKDGGVASTMPTPLMWSLYEKIMETTMPAYFKRVGLHPKRPVTSWTKRFLGYPYWNLSAVKQGVMKIPGFVEREFDKNLGIKPTYSGSGQVTCYNIKTIISGLEILCRINWSIKSRLFSAAKTITYMRAKTATLAQQNLAAMTDKALANWVDTLINVHYKRHESEYFTTIYDNSNAATLFKDALKKYNAKAKHPANELYLIGGLEEVSHLQHVHQLWRLSREMLLQPDQARKFQTYTVASLCERYRNHQDYPFAEQLNRYIEAHKHHSQRELDLLVPCWDEDPSQVFQSLLNMLTQGKNANPLIVQGEQKGHYLREKQKICSRALKRHLRTHRSMLVLREEMRDLSTQMYRIIRHAYLELGHRLCAINVLNAAEHIFYLDYRDALAYFRHPQSHHIAEKLKKNQAHYKSFRHYNKPNEIFGNEGLPTDEPLGIPLSSRYVLAGTPCSPGIVEGEVWVQRDPNAVAEVKSGTILVAPYTDPSYTLLFSSIVGLVTETGGILSHGAVVSREYGIPAVLAVKNACSQLKTGMRIRVNGHLGEVSILYGD